MPASHYDVAVSNSQTAIPIEDEAIVRIVETTLSAEHVAQATISVALVDNPTMRDLNRRHLDHDYDTDVLSFLLDSEQVAENDDDSPTSIRGFGKHLDGEIIISADMAVDRAAEFGWAPEKELTLYLVHGLLHLAGYDDTTEGERELMRQREREVLARLDV